MASNKDVLNVRYDPEVYVKIKIMAKQQNRSMSNLVEYWSLIHLKEYEDEHGSIDLSTYEEEAANQIGGSNKILKGPAARSEAEFKQSYRNEMNKKNRN